MHLLFFVQALTYSTVAVTLGVVVVRPRLGATFRVTPAMAALTGVAVLAAFGVVRLDDLAWAAETMWRPLLGIVAIMVMTGVARRVGVLDGIADAVFARAGASPRRLFALVFAFGALTAGVLNNDSAVLLLTPLVVDLARRRQPHLVVPLAFAVFLSAGIAPVMVSNPMNMVVATVAGIGFNEYARAMLAPAIVGALVTFVAARLFFRRDLAAPAAPPPAATTPSTFGRAQKIALGAVLAVVGAYPLVSLAGGTVWVVAIVGAAVLLLVAARAGHRPRDVVRHEVHFDVLVFLAAVLVLSLGLRNAGVVDHLARAYEGASPVRIGAVSALGSAVLNNHPMANLNMLALAGRDHTSILAALVGGDLGPRFFPMGSLAGLLWLEMLRRSGVAVGVGRFLLVGMVATLPTLVVCLLLLG